MTIWLLMETPFQYNLKELSGVYLYHIQINENSGEDYVQGQAPVPHFLNCLLSDEKLVLKRCVHAGE